ncbi:MAG: hypothetical protein ACK2UY_11350 [Anaerolineae bacterium]
MQIKRILTVPIVVSGAEGEPAQALSIGLLLNDGRVAWGDCAGTDPPPAYDEALATLQHVVAPPLEGRTPTGFRELAAEMDALTETVTVTSTRRPAADEGDAGEEGEGRQGFSRRALLTAPARLFQVGGQTAEEKEARTEQVRVDRRLHPAIRYGVSQALLGAVALGQGQTMAQVVSEEWGLDPPAAPVPLHTRCSYEAGREIEAAIRHRAASLGTGITDAAAQVGPDGGHLTRHLRRLAEQIAAAGDDAYRPAIHLDLAGALGQIADHNPGHMLGHLYAWRMAAGSYPLRVEDPMLLDDRQAQLEALRTLHDYLRLRKIDVQLVAGRGIEGPHDMAAFLPGAGPAKPGADLIHLRMPPFGSLHNAVEAVLACRRAGVGVLLDGGPAGADTQAAVHMALAARPDLLVAGPEAGVGAALSLAHNEMARTLAAIAVVSSRGK